MSDFAPAEWERVAPWLEKALVHAGGTHSIEDVRAACERGDLFLVTRPRFALVVEMVAYPRFSALNVFLAGGEANESLSDVCAILPTLEEACRRQGGRMVTFTGRPGWGRAVADQGYKPTATVFAKEVS